MSRITVPAPSSRDRPRQTRTSEAEKRPEPAHTTRSRGARRFELPMKYDESGFPIPERPPSLAERVRRLLSG